MLECNVSLHLTVFPMDLKQKFIVEKSKRDQGVRQIVAMMMMMMMIDSRCTWLMLGWISCVLMHSQAPKMILHTLKLYRYAHSLGANKARVRRGSLPLRLFGI